MEKTSGDPDDQTSTKAEIAALAGRIFIAGLGVDGIPAISVEAAVYLAAEIIGQGWADRAYARAASAAARPDRSADAALEIVATITKNAGQRRSAQSQCDMELLRRAMKTVQGDDATV